MTDTLLKPLKPHEAPHGDWTYVDPDSHISKTLPSYHNLKEWAVAHRKANNYPIGTNWIDQFDANICKHSKMPNCKDMHPDAVDFATTLHLQDIVRGTFTISQILVRKALHALGFAANPLVDQAEADRRAAICINCPNNVAFAKPCAGICQELAVVVNSIKGARRTKYDDSLKACRVCKCFNAAQVWVNYDLLRKTVTKQQDAYWPDFCWKRPKTV